MSLARRVVPPLLLLVAAGSAACRSHRGLQEEYAKVLRPAALRGAWDRAAEALEEERGDTYREEDRVLYWLERGTALHYAGELEASSRAFFSAEEEIQRLFTKSVSEEIGRFVATETVQTYDGEDYERILTYLYTAMNAAQRGDIQDALVEARRADEFLKRMRVRAERQDGGGTIYTQDAFMLWWVGLFLEMEGSYTDAFLAYRAAFRVYDNLYRGPFRTPAPPYLAEDLVRSALLSGQDDEADRWRNRLGASGETYEMLKAGLAEVILVHGSGEAPYKREQTFTAPVDNYIVHVAIPEIVARPGPAVGSRLVVGGASDTSVVAEPVATIAVQSFREREGAIKARAVARAAIKYAATKASSAAVRGDGKDDGRRLAGALVNILGNIASAASEGADLRSWNLLPAEFRVARVWVRPGEQPLRVERLGARGGTLLEGTIELSPGERKIISVRSLR